MEWEGINSEVFVWAMYEHGVVGYVDEIHSSGAALYIPMD
jgi:hypothetical protein